MAITNAALADQITALVAAWRLRDTEYATWLAGTATGGPFSDGRYPLTDYLGTVIYVKCPAALQASVDGVVTGAQGYSTSASSSASGAAGSATAASTAAGLALTYRDAAISARDVALNYRNEAATSAAALTALAGKFLQGTSGPEGIVSSSPGVFFTRTDTGAAYIKATGTGNTGWRQLALV